MNCRFWNSWMICPHSHLNSGGPLPILISERLSISAFVMVFLYPVIRLTCFQLVVIFIFYFFLLYSAVPGFCCTCPIFCVADIKFKMSICFSKRFQFQDYMYCLCTIFNQIQVPSDLKWHFIQCLFWKYNIFFAVKHHTDEIRNAENEVVCTGEMCLIVILMDFNALKLTLVCTFFTVGETGNREKQWVWLCPEVINSACQHVNSPLAVCHPHGDHASSGKYCSSLRTSPTQDPCKTKTYRFCTQFYFILDQTNKI